jgi:hypothetical protein
MSPLPTLDAMGSHHEGHRPPAFAHGQIPDAACLIAPTSPMNGGCPAPPGQRRSSSIQRETVAVSAPVLIHSRATGSTTSGMLRQRTSIERSPCLRAPRAEANYLLYEYKQRASGERASVDAEWLPFETRACSGRCIGHAEVAPWGTSASFAGTGIWPRG